MTDEEKIKKTFVNNSIPTIQEEVIILRIKNEELVKENADLEKTIEELQLNLKSKNDLVEELTMKIEGMKNVGNCNKAMKCSKWVEQHIQGNKVTCCCGCVEWELAE